MRSSLLQANIFVLLLLFWLTGCGTKVDPKVTSKLYMDCLEKLQNALKADKSGDAAQAVAAYELFLKSLTTLQTTLGKEADDKLFELQEERVLKPYRDKLEYILQNPAANTKARIAKLQELAKVLQTSHPGPGGGLANLLPATTLLLLNAPKTSGQDGSLSLTNLGKLLQEPDVKALLEPAKTACEPLLDNIEQLCRQDFGKSLDEVLHLVAGEIAVAVVEAGSDKPLSLVLSLEIDNKEKSRLWGCVDVMMKRYVQQPLSQVQIAGTPFWQITDPAGKLLCGMIGNRLVAATSSETVQQMIQHQVPVLAASPNFCKIIEQTAAAGQVACHGYLNIEQLFKALPLPPEIVSLSTLLGIAGWKSLGWSLGAEDNQSRAAFCIYCPDDQRGLTKFFAGDDCLSTHLALVPHNAPLYIESSHDLKQSWIELLAMLRQLSPQLYGAADESLHLTAVADVLRSIGKEWAYFAMKPEPAGFFNEGIYLVSTPDKDNLAKQLEFCWKGWGLEEEVITYKGHQIHAWKNKLGTGDRLLNLSRQVDLKLLALLNPYRAYFFVNDNTLAFSSLFQSLRSYADCLEKKEPTIADKLQPVLAQIGSHRSFVYREPQGFAAGYREFLSLLQSVEGVVRDFGVPLEVARLPQAKVVEKYLLPETIVMRSRPESFGGVVYSSGIPDFSVLDNGNYIYGGSPIMTVMVPIIAAIAIPGLLRAKTSSHEGSAIGMLRSLSTSQAQFQSQAMVDEDQDGTGEYAFLQELAGTVACRGSGQAANPTFITPVLGITAKTNRGIATKNGYYFRCYLPDQNGWVAESFPLPTTSPDFVNHRELKFVIYAWPVKYGNTGTRVFVVDESGEVLSAPNDRRYSGTINMPQAEAAFNPQALQQGQYQLSPSLPALDGQLWTPGW